MEYLDIYDENGNHLGKENRSIVHREALWHKTVHCWLYDKSGNVFFQIRKDEGTLYTTASGHLKAGETISEGFKREIKEEIGIDIDATDAVLVDVVKFKLDRENKDGTIFKDRAFANVYVDLYEGNCTDFNFDSNEVSGLVLVNADDALNLFKEENGTILGKRITFEDNQIKIAEKNINFNEFLVNKGETAIEKYGDVLNKIIEITKKAN